MQHLVEDHSVVDPTYIEDFLLTYRTFLPRPLSLGHRLLEWFKEPSLRDKVHAPYYTYILQAPYDTYILQHSLPPHSVCQTTLLSAGVCRRSPACCSCGSTITSVTLRRRMP